MNLINMIFDWKNKNRDVITEETPIPERSTSAARENAIAFADALEGEFESIRTVNKLLSSPLVKYNKDKHLSLTLAPKEWLNEGNPLTVLFSLETNEPISAYFADDGDG